MAKAKKTVEFGWVVKHLPTGKYFDDDRDLVVSISEAEQFNHEQDAKNYRDQIVYHTGFNDVEPQKIRVTTEEV